ncbi:hypothetical protein E4K67_18645 [Desulfosporosinus fructosivorans]|uniref:Uncharacterized protein n=1 Tax=Desulfosporosinus fructosivorans TaxID=2018669 RepID=A0A4Z0R278_9FIRM|nr:hypothetical protein [Desulfosporosinus fructosivorans]TGE36475.1 hypothetical protein E4K67_18645 [Desulfosporosinus fructosivorans]
MTQTQMWVQVLGTVLWLAFSRRCTCKNNLMYPYGCNGLVDAVEECGRFMDVVCVLDANTLSVLSKQRDFPKWVMGGILIV